ncbi:MAG: hypothetical protein OEM26_13600, partial [Saprospiraceae bacterium]|nr:hypothetical protein [Saprospiraceae bacterium]
SGDIAKLKHGVPLYEAYQWNLKGVNTGRQDYLKKAIELDPNFYQPYVWLITNYYWMNRMDLVDSIWNVVRPSWDKFTPYEQNMLSSAYAFSEKRYNEAYRYAYENARQYPEDYYSSTEAGMLALVWLNQPHHCLNILAKLTRQKFDYDNEPSKSRWLIYYHQALIRLGKFDEVEASCLSLISQHIQNFNAVLRPLVTTYGLQGNRASIEEMLSGTEREAVFPRYIINNLMGMGVYYLALGGHQQEALELKDELLKRIRQDPSDPPMSLSREISLHILYRGSAAGLHYFTQDWKAALREIQSFTFAEFKDYVYYLGRLGAIYARLGERDLALLIIDKLMEKNRQNQELVGFDSSLLFYCIAQIQALLGDKSEAVATLNHALEAGMGHIFEFVHFDMDLESLRGYPPFDELLQPDD